MKRILLLIFLITTVAFQIIGQVTVTGVVKDKNGEPMPGVTVVAKQADKTLQGTVTDIDGKYILKNVPADATLAFSFIGLQPQNIIVGAQSEINVTMLESTTDLDEVIVVGYGSQKRAHLTGSVTSISAAEIQDIPSANLSTALEGRLAGVQISQASGKPGASTYLKIRESTSFGDVSETPLYIIDDVIREKDDFDILDPSEVESISILKDASAGVYGVKAAAGVVLVKTKRGSIGKVKVNYSGSVGITDAINTTEMLNAYQHATMLNDGSNIQKFTKADLRRYAEDELQYFKDSIPNGGYNWLNQAWKPARLDRHNINFSGGSEKFRYFIGGSYLKETGSIEGLYVSKYTLRSNIEIDLLKNLTGSFEVGVGNEKNNTPINPQDNESDIMAETFRALLQNPQWVPPTINGLPVYQNGIITSNPFVMWTNNNYKKGETNSINAIASLEYKIPFIKGLKAKVQISQTKNFSNAKTYYVKAYGYNFETSGSKNHIIRPDANLVTEDPDNGVFSKQVISGVESLEESSNTGYNYQTNLSISYTNKFNKHDINALVICEISESESERIGWKRSGSQVVEGSDMLWGFNKNDEALTQNPTDNGTLGYIGRINYNFDSKYLAELSVRFDASTKYAPDIRWGVFPSALLGWVISEENFFKSNIHFINFLKLRTSVGLLGNDGVAPFLWMLHYGPAAGSMFGDQLNNGLEAKNNAFVNPNITWQKTMMYNAGLDLRLWDSKISFNIDGFYKYTYDIMYPVSSELPTTVGNPGSHFQFNTGIMHAYGYELEIGYKTKLPLDIDFQVKGNFSFAEAMKLKVSQAPGAIGKWYDELKNYTDNQPGAISSGIVRTKDELDDILMDNPNYKDGSNKLELGMLNYKDIRGTDGSEGPNGTFNFDQIEDRTTIANHTSPKYIYGTTFDFGWKGIKINMTFSGKFGHKVFYDKESMTSPTAKTNVPSFWADHWTPTNPNAAYPRAYSYGLDGNYSTFWMRDGHTLRLTDLSVSYSLPSKITKYFEIQQLRVFFNTKYLWTIINPLDYKDANLARYNGYPMTRTYNFGLTCSF